MNNDLAYYDALYKMSIMSFIDKDYLSEDKPRVWEAGIYNKSLKIDDNLSVDTQVEFQTDFEFGSYTKVLINVLREEKIVDDLSFFDGSRIAANNFSVVKNPLYDTCRRIISMNKMVPSKMKLFLLPKSNLTKEEKNTIIEFSKNMERDIYNNLEQQLDNIELEKRSQDNHLEIVDEPKRTL